MKSHFCLVKRLKCSKRVFYIFPFWDYNSQFDTHGLAIKRGFEDFNDWKIGKIKGFED